MAESRQAVAVVGAGAIGGLIAAELHAASNDVTLCARRALDRLVVERGDDGLEFALSSVSAERDALAVATTPGEVHAVRWVVIALKGQDSAAAGPWLSRLVDRDTIVVAVQNGIEHRERVGPHTHGAVLVPALANTAVERTAPGRLVHRGGEQIIVADRPGAADFAHLFDNSTLRVHVESDFVTAAWRKLLSNLAANPLTTLTNRRMEVFTDPEIRHLALGLLREALTVGRAEGAELADDEPERTLAAYDELSPEGGSSMLYDRMANRPLELDPLTGAVMRAAHRHNLPAPLNHAVFALLSALDRTLGDH